MKTAGRDVGAGVRHGMMPRLARVAAALAFGMGTASAQNTERPELTVAVAHWPPWKIVHEDGSVGGHDADILRAMEGQLGVTFAFKAYPWKRCVEMLKLGRINVVSSGKLSEILGPPGRTTKETFQEEDAVERQEDTRDHVPQSTSPEAAGAGTGKAEETSE
ncbi:MAG: transporter substrate-binding domain-containing protein [Lentisphaerae bacterium]|jgi:hypothetical protein|nr:transporter substrate-binding domain-containing protein [Lentisphaerota bacterium]MBT4815944.1 transporter substrate-binding domain-containing protein [Lentisphaerota bacterium]MBT5606876.1 transporter substrate-binding domain-containing protein [Lentisphaerota bacterium]MBT7058322.1 transporter substrate-binding domain-containing protein [Lentisphaerota bacterium]MBT7843595.1 transporter substrate-binding domain-containing protein [Lentisphaerota bacterium]